MPRDRRPLPLQVREAILAQIRSEGLRPGDRLPSEADLAVRFDVGRTTAREALKLLEQDGIVDVRHGSGRFVSQMATLERPVTQLESVTELMGTLGYSVVNRIVSVTERPASAEEAACLGLASGESVIRLERVRLHGEEPLIYSVDVFARSLLDEGPEGIDWSGSLFELLESRGVRVVSALAQLRAVRLPKAGREAIGRGTATGRRTGEPWLLLAHRNLDPSGRVVVTSEDYYRGDRFSFNVLRRRV